jgi:ankyrin repeat protein
MRGQLATLAYNGQWTDLLALLRHQPDLPMPSNAASTGKGYTPLHQAAWHGAGLPVVGALLALGADRRLSTKEGQTARDIARSRHYLHYILSPSTRSLRLSSLQLIVEAG